MHFQVYAAALELVNTVLAEESVKASVNALLVASSHKASAHRVYVCLYICIYVSHVDPHLYVIHIAYIYMCVY